MNNIFTFATSELSQDAYICWLVNSINHKEENPALYEKAKEFLTAILPDQKEFEFNNVRIYKQFYNMDVVAVVDDKHVVLIEDKTFTSEHSDQINTYKGRLLKNNYKEMPENLSVNDITTVYYKISDEFGKNNNADVVLSRKDILGILKDDGKEITSDIYKSYYEYLSEIERKAHSYEEGAVENWEYPGYAGFFKSMENEDTNWWGYVPNKSGGFMCYTWHNSIDKLNSNCEAQDIFKELKIQLELGNGNVISLKGQVVEGKDARNVRHQIYDYMKEYLDTKEVAYDKKIFRDGTYVSIGHVDVAGDSQLEIIHKMGLMQEALDSCVGYLNENCLKKDAQLEV